MNRGPSSVGREARRFYETTALAVTFLTFSVVVTSIVDWNDLIAPLNIVFLLIAAITFIFFVIFSIGLVRTQVTDFYDSVFVNLGVRKNWIFISILWPAIVTGFIAALFLSEAIKLPQFLKGPAIWLALFWLVYVIAAILVRRRVVSRMATSLLEPGQTNIVGGDLMASTISNNTDDYVETVIGKPRKELISAHIEDKAATRAKVTEEADRLFGIAARESSSAALTKACTTLIDESRKIIRAPDFNADDALDKLDDVKCHLIRAYESRKLWPKLFGRIFGVNLVYIGLFIGIIVWKGLLPLSSSAPAGMGVGILSCAIWGGIGGVVDALIALHSHFTTQDFDKQYEPWYYLHPFIGMSLGAIVYLVLQAGLATISNSNIAAGNGTSTVQVGITAFSIAVAFLAGFKQNAAIEFLSRVVKSVFQKENSEDKKSS